MKGLSVAVKPSYYSASYAVLTGSNGSGVSMITNPASSVAATTSVVDQHVTYTLTAYGQASLSWSPLQSFNKVYLSGGSYNNTDVSSVNSVNNVTLGTTYTLVYHQQGSNVTLTSTVTPNASVANNNIVSTQINSTPSRATITTPPNPVAVGVGSSATFSGQAGGFPSPTIQWQVSPDGVHWSNIGDSGLTYTVNDTPGHDTTTGWTNTSLSVKNVTIAMNGYQFQFIGTNPDGSATSAPAATLTVTRVTPGSDADIPAMPPVALGAMAAMFLAAGYKFLPKKPRE